MAARTKKRTKTKTVKKAPVKKTEAKPFRKPQVRVLQYLAKQKKPRTRNEISKGANVEVASLTEYLGSNNAESRAKNDKRFFKSLRTLKLVKTEQDEKELFVYSITALGRKAV